MRLASGDRLNRGYGESALVPNGLDGKPIISNPAGAQPGGWDSLVFERAAADPIVAQRGQPFTVVLVERRRAAVSCDIMKLYSDEDTHVHFSPRANGAILIGQNDGRGVSTEANAEPLNQWDILYYIYDGQHAWLLRNRRCLTATPDYVGEVSGRTLSKYSEIP